MKKLLIIFSIFAAITGNAQKVTQDKDGNYIAVKSSQDTAKSAVNTWKFYQDQKGVKYPVYVSAKGKLFIFKTAKESGNIYKMYLKIN